NTEFPEQSSYKSFKENDGNKDDGDGYGSCNYCKVNFFGTFLGSKVFWNALFNFFINIFSNHNTIIHHKPCCQNDTQKGEYVNGKSGYIHDEECANQTHRNIYQRAKRYQPVAEEEVNYQYHQYYGDDKGFFHLHDRFADELGLIEGNVQGNIFRNFFFQLFEPSEKLIGNSHII